MCWTEGRQNLAILVVRTMTTLDEGEYRLVLVSTEAVIIMTLNTEKE